MVVAPPDASRRRHKRVALELPITLITTSYGTTNVETARALDLSEGGMAILATKSYPAYQPVSIEFRLPLQDLLLKVAAEVLYRADGRHGLRFVALSDEQLNHLRRMVN